MFRLENTVMEYDWGSPTALPELFGVTPDGRPKAELWIGTHPGAPSRLADDTRRRTLAELIAEDVEYHLGTAGSKQGGQLPFLLKLLAARKPLSIQVHPNREQARTGYEREEALGVPLDSSHRNYRDRNHKPEVICALTPFEALCGWRQPTAAAHLLASLNIPALEPWAARLLARPTPETLRQVLAEILAPLGNQAHDAAATLTWVLSHRAGERNPLGSICTALAPAAEAYPGDPGLVVALLLNHVTLAPGQALYLDPRRPHAYLHGLGVELMASSDNVLRCGLTTKHVDADELLAVADFTSPQIQPLIPRPGLGTTHEFPTPTRDFRLLRHALDPNEVVPAGSPRLFLATEGRTTLSLPGTPPLRLAPGDAVFVSAAEGPLTLAGSPRSVVFQATLPNSA